jgi:hypothetical protein
MREAQQTVGRKQVMSGHAKREAPLVRIEPDGIPTRNGYYYISFTAPLIRVCL